MIYSRHFREFEAVSDKDETCKGRHSLSKEAHHKISPAKVIVILTLLLILLGVSGGKVIINAGWVCSITLRRLFPIIRVWLVDPGSSLPLNTRLVYQFVETD